MQGQLGIVFASEGMPGTKCGAASLFYHDREDEEKRQAGQEQTILLEMACRVGHLEVVKYLLGEGARCGPPSEGVVQELLPRSKPEIATWLRSIIGWQPLHFACEADDEPMIMRLLLAGAWSMRLWFGSQVRTRCSLDPRPQGLDCAKHIAQAPAEPFWTLSGHWYRRLQRQVCTHLCVLASLRCHSMYCDGDCDDTTLFCF